MGNSNSQYKSKDQIPRFRHYSSTQWADSDSPPAYEASPPVYSASEGSNRFTDSKASVKYNPNEKPDPARGLLHGPFAPAMPAASDSTENALEMLKRYNTVFIVDDSRSMYPLWAEACEALACLAETANRYDTDGIDVHFINDLEKTEPVGMNLKNEQAVRDLFNSRLATGKYTPIGEKLELLLREYLKKLKARSEVKRVNYIIISDGDPTDEPAYVIKNEADKLDKLNAPLCQVGIQFVQIGNSPKATAYLQGLDDELKEQGVSRDIVDTTIYDGKLTDTRLIKILLGGINRRIDDQK
ncbi:hypothetical protein BDQ12DRAFT_731833 [Crucibulum laeve]|uniref:VWFA domain-containing protein n=1 Tax=Crucibulum laeve TaxID=68775 RepID=A0A5C3MHL2_9AGAR|nr:hypothetical protein BDQ12DRAFT_731833 [Crucibulum laeve]